MGRSSPALGARHAPAPSPATRAGLERGVGRAFAMASRMSSVVIDIGGRAGVGSGSGDLAHRGAVWLDAHPLAERVLIAVTVTTLWSGGYHLIGWGTDPARTTSLATGLDRAIPFIPETVYLYGLVYGAALYPLIALRSRRLLYRTTLAYLLVIGASLTCFMVFPVAGVDFRPPVSSLDEQTLHGWSLRLIYTLDPPANMFPSLHVGLAAIAAASLWRAHRGHGLLAGAIVGATLVSICTVKQHFLADAVGALVVAAVVDDRVLRPVRADPADGPVAFSWPGAVGYLALQTGIYAACGAAFLAGVRAW